MVKHGADKFQQLKKILITRGGPCREAAGLQPPQQSCYILHFIGFRFKTRSHIKIVFYNNQIQSNFILCGARTLLLVQQATDVLMPFPPPLDCQYILRFKHACFLPSPSSFMRPLPDCILCSQGAIFGCRLCLSSARAISVKCFEVHVFIYSDQMVSSIFIYIICIYLYLNCALYKKCYLYEPQLGLSHFSFTIRSRKLLICL